MRRKTPIRSRASGWNWGESRAASQAATSACLRRRAIVVSRARSPERNSTGGRVSARAAAGESSGSARTRSQAIVSRTSGLAKSAAGPGTWEGEGEDVAVGVEVAEPAAQLALGLERVEVVVRLGGERDEQGALCRRRLL